MQIRWRRSFFHLPISCLSLFMAPRYPFTEVPSILQHILQLSTLHRKERVNKLTLNHFFIGQQEWDKKCPCILLFNIPAISFADCVMLRTEEPKRPCLRNRPSSPYTCPRYINAAADLWLGKWNNYGQNTCSMRANSFAVGFAIFMNAPVLLRTTFYCKHPTTTAKAQL